MTNPENISNQNHQVKVESSIALTGISIWCSRVFRVPRYPDGRRESDVEHSFMLARLAPHLAKKYYPELDAGLISQFAIEHDSDEAITGDISTLGISDEDRVAKEQLANDAVKQMITILHESDAGDVAEILETYHDQRLPETRFVRLVDKLMPLLVDIANAQANFDTTYEGITKAELIEMDRIDGQKLRNRFPEFPKLHDIFDELTTRRSRAVFGE